ncbi:MAG: GNAT family N-acetyltransferase [Anaerolineales bacterium]|nr:GNAT family N-acetyltransferase [Anaerolineales bacterium]MCZ2290009.1 GNAT family N-acetyltransferase [Anaerolineales bacterium]
MNIRPVREEDIEAIINLFRVNYGEDYAIPEFYDPMWVKRGIYSDHIIWLVVEDEGRVVASGACILNAGDYNDNIGEIGRVVVDPEVGGKGLGRSLLAALIDASDERVEFAFAEARTVHPKTQKICEHLGMAPLGFLPMAYQMTWRESFFIHGQLFGNGRLLREPESAVVIPEVAPLAALSLKNLGLGPSVATQTRVKPYPSDRQLEVKPLTGKSMVRLLKIEHGRYLNPEIFSALQVDMGYAQLHAHRADYLVAQTGDTVLGAVGFLFEEHDKTVRLIELIGEDDAAQGTLLRMAVETAEQKYNAEVLVCDVSAESPRLQQSLLELGFLPAAYIPGMVFHRTHRPDVVKMMKLRVKWDLGPMELTDASREYFNIVAPAFEKAS